MADLARMAGVSVSTVSRALAGSPLVSPGTRRRIAELAQQLNYSVHVGAQNLRRGSNRTIAVVVPFDAQARQTLSEPFFLALIGSLADALTERGYDMLLSRVDAERLDGIASLVHSGRAAGVVLVGQWRHHDQLNAMAAQRLPFVVWGARVADQLYTTVGSDNVRGGELATVHLLQSGARCVAFLGDPALPEVGQRHEGWRRALAAHGLQPQPAWLRPAPFTREGTERAVAQLLAELPQVDAIVAAGDLMAIAAISALRAHGRRVPQDVRVTGYDDIALAEHCHPPLTTVRQPMPEAGLALVDALLQRLDGEVPLPTLLATQLVVRDSSVPLAG